jgi:hypothetical protein
MSSQLKLLRTYAKLDDASIAKLPPTVYFSHTGHTLTIFDAYPKALFHFLVLPRLLRTRRATSDTTGTTTAVTAGDHVCPTGDNDYSGTSGDGDGDGQGQGAASPQGVVVPLTANKPEGAAAAAAADELLTMTASTGDLTNLCTLLRRATAKESISETGKNDDVNAAAAAAAAFLTLRVLEDEAGRVRREIEREMEVRYGFVWDIWFGFHAVPSME